MVERKPLRVLLIEDDPDDVALLRRAIMKSPIYDVDLTVVHDSESALVEAAKNRFDLWFVDYFLGSDVGLNVLTLSDASKRQPVILISGVNPYQIQEQVQVHGVLHHIYKDDITTTLLDSIVRTALYQYSTLNIANDRLHKLEADLADRRSGLADFAHEIGNLVSMAQAASHFSRKGSPATALEFVDLMDDQMSQVMATSRRFLESAVEEHLRSDQAEMRTERAISIVERAGRLVNHVLSEKGQRLSIAADDTALTIDTDATLLTQVILNLVLNASKHSGADDEIRIEIGGTRDRVEIAIVDRGRGMDSPDLERLRKRFQRGTETKAEGHGLGLAIVERFLKALGGTLDIESQLGLGTRMKVLLPLANQKPNTGRQVPVSEDNMAAAE